VSMRAASRGLTVAPISQFCMTPIEIEGLVLGYGGLTQRQIGHGVAELAAVLEACAPARPPKKQAIRAAELA